ncbi:hypothetical protein HZF02_32250 (plasmid) [Pseudomonas yamanorum]|nr:hypothetical protein HZF02_32250 [Pseudomonas yamanorum]
MSDCVPYAIHIATGEELPVVMSLAEQRGWDREKGMNGVAAWYMLRDDMGFQISPMQRPPERVTLKRFLPTLDANKTYIIDTSDHWFTVHKGQRFDKANTHPRKEVFVYIEVEPPGATA